MGFYIRKSLRVGPFRFNLSKSCLGVSAGIKGFRLGTGPKGNYIHAGVGGVYYRKTLSKNSKNNNQSEVLPTQQDGDLPWVDEVTEIDSNVTTLLENSSEDELVKEITSKVNKFYFWKWIAAITLAIFYYTDPAWGWISLALTVLCYYWDQVRKSVVLFYDFDKPNEDQFGNIVQNFEKVLAINKIWHIESYQNTSDWKRNAGAGTLLKRTVTPASLNPPKFIKANIPIPTIGAGNETLCFLPNKLLILTKESAATLDYEDLDIQICSTRFIESDSVPSDAVVVDHTWEYVNKKGGPDKRFKNNRKLPICQYEQVLFESKKGLNEMLNLSKCGQFELFKNTLKGIKNKAA